MAGNSENGRALPLTKGYAGRRSLLEVLGAMGADRLQSPVPRTSETVHVVTQLSQSTAVNCAMCHGYNGDEQSVIAEEFAQAGGVPSADFRAARAYSQDWLAPLGTEHSSSSLPALAARSMVSARTTYGHD